MRQTGCAFLAMTLLFMLAGCYSQETDNSFSDDFSQTSDVPRTMPATTASASMDEKTSLPELTDAATLDDYLLVAALNNPGLEAAFNRFKAALEGIPQARSLPDPRFTYRYYIEQVETRVGAQKQAFGISQLFPWFGKLDLKADAAGQAAHAARQRYESAKLKLFYQVKEAWYEYYYLGRSIDIIRENIELVKNFEGVARARYRAAAAGHPDVIRAQVELGKLEDQLNSLRDFQGPVAARLNAALNRPPQTPVAAPTRITEERIALTDAQVLEWMACYNPELSALEYEAAADRTQIDLARKEYYPDVTFGLDFIDTADSISAVPPRDSGQDPIIAMVSINLPIWREKLDAGVRQARHRYLSSRQEKNETQNKLNVQLQMALYAYRDGRRKVNLYRDTLLPKAVESLKATQASFRTGDDTFLDLIDAQRVMLEFELAYERALSGQAQRLAEMDMLVGTSLPRDED